MIGAVSVIVIFLDKGGRSSRFTARMLSGREADSTSPLLDPERNARSRFVGELKDRSRRLVFDEFQPGGVAKDTIIRTEFDSGTARAVAPRCNLTRKTATLPL
jgi:hypothetical protein